MFKGCKGKWNKFVIEFDKGIFIFDIDKVWKYMFDVIYKMKNNFF